MNAFRRLSPYLLSRPVRRHPTRSGLSLRECQSSSSSFRRVQEVSKRNLKQRPTPSALDVENGDGICAAYCAANSIRLAPTADLLRDVVIRARKHGTRHTFRCKGVRLLATDVVHAEIGTEDAGDGARMVHFGHAFFFSSGAAVFWGLPQDVHRVLFDKLHSVVDVVSARDGWSGWPKLKLEDFDHEFRFLVDGAETTPTFRHDEIRVCDLSDARHLLALSYGLAQSTKLLMYEEAVDSLVTRTRRLPEDLARDGEIRLSQRELKRLIGELLAARYCVNLVSDILDTPEFFWGHADLEPAHMQCTREVELRQRAAILDARTQVIKDVLDLLNNELSTTSSTRVERAILALIAVEVLIELARMTLILPP